MGLFVTFDCLFKLPLTCGPLQLFLKHSSPPPMLPTLQQYPVTCGLLNSYRPHFCMFYSVPMGYSIQLSLPTFLHVANLFYLSELNSCHPFLSSSPLYQFGPCDPLLFLRSPLSCPLPRHSVNTAVIVCLFSGPPHQMLCPHRIGTMP